jgi:hypothetical protein
MSALTPGRTLRFRLERETPWGVEAGCSVAIGFFLLLFGGTIAYLDSTRGDGGIALVFGGAFGFIGLLVTAAGYHQVLARRRTPETILEIEALPVERGRTVRLLVVQPGPANLQSLRVNVLCMVTTKQWRTRGNERHLDRDVRLLYQHNVLDVKAVTVPRGEELAYEAQLVVPSEQPPTGGSGAPEDPEHAWRLEVWGRVRWGADLMHPFVIEVQ